MLKNKREPDCSDSLKYMSANIYPNYIYILQYQLEKFNSLEEL